MNIGQNSVLPIGHGGRRVRLEDAPSRLATWAVLLSLAGIGCTEDPTASLPLGESLDAGAAGDAETSIDGGLSRDAGGPPLNSDIGPHDLDPPIRSVLDEPLIEGRERDNHLLLPDFETEVVNGGWLGLPLTADAVGLPQWRRRVHWEVPGPRTELAVLPGSTAFAGGAGLYGFGIVPPGPVVGSVWVGLQNPEPEDWSEVVPGLILFVEGMGPSVLFFDGDATTEVELGGWRWRLYSGSSGASVQGRVTFGVQNAGQADLRINAPDLRPAPANAKLMPSRMVSVRDAPAWAPAIPKD